MLRCPRFPSPCWVVLTFFLVFPACVLGQIQNGQFTGVIEDPTGANLPNARVSIKNLETDFELVVYSNEVGIYAAKELTVGRYQADSGSCGVQDRDCHQSGIECGDSCTG